MRRREQAHDASQTAAGGKEQRTRHDHERHHNLGDHVEDGVGAHLERDRERSKALGEQPHHGVADPGEDGKPGELTVQRRDRTTLSISVGLEGLREVHKYAKQRHEADEEPEPLDGGDYRDGPHVARSNVDACTSKNYSHAT